VVRLEELSAGADQLGIQEEAVSVEVVLHGREAKVKQGDFFWLAELWSPKDRTGLVIVQVFATRGRALSWAKTGRAVRGWRSRVTRCYRVLASMVEQQ